eukprot:g17055.t1
MKPLHCTAAARMKVTNLRHHFASSDTLATVILRWALPMQTPLMPSDTAPAQTQFRCRQTSSDKSALGPSHRGRSCRALGSLESALGLLESALGLLESALGLLKSALGLLESTLGPLESALGLLESTLGLLE